MSLTYQWKLTGLKKTSSNNLSNVIVQTYWKVTGTDEDDVSGEFSGATPFSLSNVDPNNFIAYENLTEELILSWIQNIVVGDYKDHIDQVILKQIDNKKNPIEEVTDFPWNASANT